jgi:hypothetical protein
LAPAASLLNAFDSIMASKKAQQRIEKQKQKMAERSSKRLRKN